MNEQILAAEHYLKVVRGEIPRSITYDYEKTYNYILEKLCSRLSLK